MAETTTWTDQYGNVHKTWFDPDLAGEPVNENDPPNEQSAVMQGVQTICPEVNKPCYEVPYFYTIEPDGSVRNVATMEDVIPPTARSGGGSVPYMPGGSVPPTARSVETNPILSTLRLGGPIAPASLALIIAALVLVFFAFRRK